MEEFYVEFEESLIPSAGQQMAILPIHKLQFLRKLLNSWGHLYRWQLSELVPTKLHYRNSGSNQGQIQSQLFRENPNGRYTLGLLLDRFFYLKRTHKKTNQVLHGPCELCNHPYT